ncbi:MAG TPA: SRPBCC family protein [Vicinamibacterales bacterium]
MSRFHRFATSTTLPLGREELFPFFADAANLEVITPPELRFAILTPGVAMREGALIRYRLRLMGVRFGWLTRIAHWDPPNEFVDEQLKGPYTTWVHRHRFTPVQGGTLMEDEVTYSLPLFPLGEIAAPLVNLQVRRIFAYRGHAIRRAFGLEDVGGPVR